MWSLMVTCQVKSILQQYHQAVVILISKGLGDGQAGQELLLIFQKVLFSF